MSIILDSQTAEELLAIVEKIKSAKIDTSLEKTRENLRFSTLLSAFKKCHECTQLTNIRTQIENARNTLSNVIDILSTASTAQADITTFDTLQQQLATLLTYVTTHDRQHTYLSQQFVSSKSLSLPLMITPSKLSWNPTVIVRCTFNAYEYKLSPTLFFTMKSQKISLPCTQSPVFIRNFHS